MKRREAKKKECKRCSFEAKLDEGELCRSCAVTSKMIAEAYGITDSGMAAIEPIENNNNDNNNNKVLYSQRGGGKEIFLCGLCNMEVGKEDNGVCCYTCNGSFLFGSPC